MNSVLDKIRRFIIKFYYCPQKIFIANGKIFFGAHPTTVKNNMIAFSGKTCLKVELFKHKNKKNSLKEEASIVKFLNFMGNLSQPRFINEGFILSGRPYMLTERIFKKGVANFSDIMLSVLEQQKAGVFHHDIKDDNIIFDGVIVKLIDYDQAEYRDEMKELSIKDNLEYFVKNQTPNWIGDCNLQEYFGTSLEETFERCKALLNGDKFNFEATSLYKRLVHKNKGLPYYSLDEESFFAKGTNNLSIFTSILDKIDFEENEKVLDCGCSVGALSFYLKRRGCDVYSFDSDFYSLLSTKILSNIMGLNLKVLNIDIKKKKNFPGKYQTVLLLNDAFYNKFKINKVKPAAKNVRRVIIKTYDLPKANELKGYELTQTFPVEGQDYIIAVLENKDN